MTYGQYIGKNDRIYGVYDSNIAGTTLIPRVLGRGKLLNESANEIGVGLQAWRDPVNASINVLDHALQTGTRVHFNLGGMQDIRGALTGTGPYASRATSIELRYIFQHWNPTNGQRGFRDVVTFWNQVPGPNGMQVMRPTRAPW
jgi:hypothetical protein